MKKIIHALNISAEPTYLFQAISTHVGLSNWWTTKVNAQEKIGGMVDFTFRGDFNPSMEITSLNKPTEIGWKCISGHEPWKDNTFSFEISQNETGSQLKFTQVYARELSDIQYGTYNFNWGYYLQSLKEYCETGKGKPFSP